MGEIRNRYFLLSAFVTQYFLSPDQPFVIGNIDSKFNTNSYNYLLTYINNLCYNKTYITIIVDEKTKVLLHNFTFNIVILIFTILKFLSC